MLETLVAFVRAIYTAIKYRTSHIIAGQGIVYTRAGVSLGIDIGRNYNVRSQPGDN